MSLQPFFSRLFMLLSALLVAFATWVYLPITLSKSSVEVMIAPNTSAWGIAHALTNNGVTQQTELFYLSVRVLQLCAYKLKAGTYLIDSGMSPQQILKKMVRGEVLRASITILEGWDFNKMRSTINTHTRLVHHTQHMSNSELLAAVGAPYAHPEGLFFPDTYVFNVGSSDLDIFKQAHTALKKNLSAAWQARAPALPYRNAYEALTVASIIEKETGYSEDRSLVAAVFINRLKQGIRLQTDPSVIYGLGPTFDGNLRKRDLLTDTPYNTYIHGGLPPTPISLPGKASIYAALHPAPSNMLYFVARGDGRSVFSKNLTDHNHAVRQWWQRSASQKDHAKK